MNKKAIYSPTLAVLTIFLIAYAIFISTNEEISYKKIAGKNQIKLIDKYQEGEFARLYIKQSARNAINNALYEFGQNGGLLKEECKNGNYFLWNKNCKIDKEDFLSY